MALVEAYVQLWKDLCEIDYKTFLTIEHVFQFQDLKFIFNCSRVSLKNEANLN